MTESATTTATEEKPQAGETTEESTTTEATTTEAITTEATTEEPKTYDEAYVKKLREEAAARRVEAQQAKTQAQQAKARAEELEREKLSDTERVKKDAETAQQRATALESRVKRAEVLSAAASKKFANVDLAADLIDLSKVELDEDGKATNADELLDDLLTKYPDLKAKEKEEQRPENLTQVLKGGDPVPAEGEILSPEAARQLLDTDPQKFNDLFDKGLIKRVANE